MDSTEAVAGKKLWSLDTGWACGGVITNGENTIIDTPPIYRKFIGKNINWLSKAYKIEFVCLLENNEFW